MYSFHSCVFYYLVVIGSMADGYIPVVAISAAAVKRGKEWWVPQVSEAGDLEKDIGSSETHGEGRR